MPVSIIASTFGWFQLKQASLQLDFPMHNVAPGIIEPATAQVFTMLICYVSTTP